MFLRRVLPWVLVGVAVVSAVGCGGGTLLVRDVNGRPIEGARVVVNEPSVSGPETFTDRSGRAQVLPPGWFRSRLMLMVSKEGYQTFWAPLPTTWPYAVMLKQGVGVGL